MEEAGAFLLGNTAGDVQTLTGQRRVETHFYTIPPGRHPRAWERMLNAYPELADPHTLSPEQAAFVSGYLVHLAIDEDWAWDVFCPLYLKSDAWPDHGTFMIHHNALRVVLDRQAEAQIRAQWEILEALRDVRADGWLPFVSGDALQQWHDWLTEQLTDATEIQTTWVFAKRMGISPEHLERVVQRVETDIDEHRNPALEAGLASFEAHAQADGLSVLRRYWGTGRVFRPLGSTAGGGSRRVGS